MGANYSILVDVELKTKQIQQQLNAAAKNIKLDLSTTNTKNYTKQIEKTVIATKQLNSATKNTSLTFQEANLIMSKSINVIGAMVKEVYKLDNATTEFKKVSDLTGASLDKYVEKLSKMGQQVARTGSEMVDAATEFRKSGFNDEDAANLALTASIYQNVADDAITAGEASNFIVAQLKAFGIEAENSMHVIDALNEVSNNFAVSSSDLSNNLGKASAALAAGNNTYEESLGMFTAITEITRNASRAARGLVSIQSRTTQILDEQSSTGKALVDIYKDLGIELFNQQGQLRSTFEIFSDLSKQWDSLDSNYKNYIALTQAGANQTQNFMALMSNFGTAINATATAYDSMGSASKENEKKMESLEAKTALLKNTFQELSNKVINSDLVKAILDLANGALKELNNGANSTIVQWGLLTGTLIGGATIFGNIGVKLLSFSKNFGTAFGLMQAGALSFSGSLVPIAGIISGIILAGGGLYNLWKKVNPTIEEAQNKIEEYNVSLKNNQDRLQQLKNIGWYNRTPEIETEITSLEKENKVLNYQIGLLEDKRKKQAQQELQNKSFGVGPSQDASFYTPTGQKRTIKVQDEFLKGEELNQRLIETLNRYSEALQKNKELQAEQQDEYQRAIETAKQRLDLMKITGEVNEDLNASFVNATNTINRLRKAEQQENQSKELVNKTNEITEKQYNALVEVLPELTDKVYKLNGEYYLEDEAIRNLINSNSEFVSRRLEEDYNLTSESIKNAQTRIMALQEENAVFQQMLNNAKTAKQTQPIGLIGGGLPGNVSRTTGKFGGLIETKIKQNTNEIANQEKSLQEAQNHLRNLLDEVIGGTKRKSLSRSSVNAAPKSTSSYKSTVDSNLEKLKEIVELRVSELNLSKARNDSEDVLIGKMREIQKALHVQADYLRKTKASQKDINALSIEWWNYEKAITEQLNKQQKYKEDLKNYISGLESELGTYDKAIKAYADKEIEKLEKHREEQLKFYDEQIKALQETNQELDNQYAKEQALENLAKARQTNLLVYKDGKYQYTQDVDAVAEAQSSLNELERQLAYEAELKRLQDMKDSVNNSVDAQIAEWEKYLSKWKDTTMGYGKEQEEMLAIQKLGAKLEANNWKDRLSNLDNFVKEYSQKLSQLKSAQMSLDNIEAGSKNKKGKTDWSAKWWEAENDKSLSKEEKKSLQNYYHQQKTEEMKGSGKHFGPGGKWYASGTTSAVGGISLVGEKGPELRVLNQGDGILPANVTKNLWSWGSMNPSEMITQIKHSNEEVASGMNVSIQNLNLPSVKDGNDFVEYLKNNFWRQTVQFAKG